MAKLTCQHVINGKLCGGTIDPVEGVCEVCGRAPDKGALLATVSVANAGTGSIGLTAGTGKPGSGRVSRRQGTASASRKTNALGAGLVSLPPVPSQDPMVLVMATPEVSPGKRICPNCGARVNRMNGFCPQCSEAYDFRPGLKAGDIVASKYEIRGPIGLGGMGWIYLGFDLVLKRWVVLKGVLNEKDPEAAAAAIAERQFLAAVKHPNIVAIYDFVSQGSQGYMVLEYVGGRTLDAIRGDFDLVDLLSPDDGKVIKAGVLRKDISPQDKALVPRVIKYGALPPEQAIAYLMELCPAFAYLHASGFTHNDMKPDNVMIDGDRVKLIDLGAMRKIGDQGGLIFGTEGFIAPEASSDPIAVSDLYAVGRTLAILLFDFLYKCRADLDATTRKTTARRFIVSSYKNALPGPDEQPILRQFDSIYRFLLRATHENPDERFQSADEMQSQLFGLLREVMALKDGPKPAESRVFFADGLVDGADVEGASAPLARLLPMLRINASDAAASALIGLSAIVDPARRIDELQALASRFSKSVEAPLRLADAMIANGQAEGALEVTERILAKDEFEWRAHWYAGKALLSLANKSADDPVGLAAKARGRFDRVYFEMPGELAPRLGLAMAAELAGDVKAAELYYNRVATIDPALASAVFGLARCRLALGDAAGAAKAISALPPSHSMYTESRFALARAYMAADPDSLAKAAEVLAAIKTDSPTLHELAAELLAKTIALLEGKQIPANPTQRMLDQPLTARALRLEAARRYGLVGRRAASAAEKARWIDMSHAIRPLTLF
jgi:serine/threonine-protein kinase PknG